MGIQEYSWVYIAIQGFTGVYMGEHEKTGVYRAIQGFTGVFITIYGKSYNRGDYMEGDYM